TAYGFSQSISISADGKYVVFESLAANFSDVHMPTTGLGFDVFIRDIRLGRTTIVSANSSGQSGDKGSGGYDHGKPVISADGHFVVYASRATNLSSTQPVGESNIYLYDAQSGINTLVSEQVAGLSGWFDFYPDMSMDGRFVTYVRRYSYPSDITRLMLFDTQSGDTYPVADFDHLKDDNDHSISADGRYISFASGIPNLVANDTNEITDVFVLPNPALDSASAVSSVAIDITLNDLPTAKPGPQLAVDAGINWSYSATNDGGVTLYGVEVRRREKLPSLMPWSTVCTLGAIQPGKTAACAMSGVSVEGQYKDLVVIHGTTRQGETVQALGNAFYSGKQRILPPASFDLQVKVNSFSTVKPGADISAGLPVLWQYQVVNNGAVILENIEVSRRQKLPELGNWVILCTIRLIQPGDTGGCSSSGEAISGVYKALVVAKAYSSNGVLFEDMAKVFYKGQAGDNQKVLTIGVTANGLIMDKPGPVLLVDSTVELVYTVANNSNTPLQDIQIKSRQKLPIHNGWSVLCTINTIQPGETERCLSVREVSSGTYKSLVVAQGRTLADEMLEDTVKVFYRGNR
ncbi:MAG: hypothetical protein V3W04_09735, partial [Gammaproteobacteria bacterium]